MMKNVRSLFGILLCLTFMGTLFLSVAPVSAAASLGNTVVDMADLLDSGEEEELQSRISELSAAWDMSFVVVTTDDADGKDSQDYADDYYDEHDYGEDGVLYLIDLDNGNVWISTSGMMIRYLTDQRIDWVIDAGYDYLHEEDYGAGLLELLDETEYYLNQGIPSNQYNEDVETGERDYYQKPKGITGTEILVALLIALVCGGAFFLSINGSYKMKRKAYKYPYWEKGRVQYTRKDDYFINQTVTRRHIPKDPSSGGGGGGSSVHTSSGGHSHGGGGRSL